MISFLMFCLSGLLDFPKSFDRAGGIFVGIAVQGVFLIFIVSALLILGKVLRSTNVKNEHNEIVSHCL